MLDFIYLKIKCNGTSKQTVIYLFSYLSWVRYLGQLGWIRPWVSRSPTPKRSIGGWGNKLRAYSAEQSSSPLSIANQFVYLYC
jgi:hypothetical protein